MIKVSRRALILVSVAAVRTVRSAEQAQMDVAITVSRQDYCKGDEEVGWVRVELECELTNRSNSPVVIASEPDPPHVIRLAATLADHESGKFVHEYSASWYQASDISQQSKTTTVAPGKSHKWRTRVQIPVTIPVGRGRSIQPGQYWLSVFVDAQPGAANAGDGQQWKPLLSRPAAIIIGAKSVFRGCS